MRTVAAHEIKQLAKARSGATPLQHPGELAKAHSQALERASNQSRRAQRPEAKALQHRLMCSQLPRMPKQRTKLAPRRRTARARRAARIRRRRPRGAKCDAGRRKGGAACRGGAPRDGGGGAVAATASGGGAGGGADGRLPRLPAARARRGLETDTQGTATPSAAETQPEARVLAEHRPTATARQTQAAAAAARHRRRAAAPSPLEPPPSAALHRLDAEPVPCRWRCRRRSVLNPAATLSRRPCAFKPKPPSTTSWSGCATARCSCAQTVFPQPQPQFFTHALREAAAADAGPQPQLQPQLQPQSAGRSKGAARGAESLG